MGITVYPHRLYLQRGGAVSPKGSLFCFAAAQDSNEKNIAFFFQKYYNRYMSETEGSMRPCQDRRSAIGSDVMWAMQQIMFKELDRRLAEFLLAEAQRTGSDTIRMTHEQIAQHISSAREAVARMLKSFSEDGLVELRRGAITLRDKNSLNHLK